MPNLTKFALILFLLFFPGEELFPQSNKRSEQADLAFKEAMGQIKAGHYKKAKGLLQKLASEFGKLPLSEELEYEIDRPGVNSYADLVRFRSPYLECLEKRAASPGILKASELADKITAGLEESDSNAIAEVAGCEVRVGPWEAGTAIYTPAELGKYLVGLRAKKKDGSRAPLALLERKSGTDSFGIVLGGFSPYDPSIPNDLLVILLRKDRTWEWHMVIETKKENVKDVLAAWIR